MSVVTVSASYGAGGSRIAPRVAEHLGVPFVDRAVPVSVAHDLGITVGEAEALAGQDSGRWWRILASMSTVSGGMISPVAHEDTMSEAVLLERTANHIRHLAETQGCVVLGHGAALLLADRPDALHVRLDGAPDGRIAAAMHQHDIDRDTAAAEQKQNDRVRSGYVRHFYHQDAASPEHYHLVLDTVRLGWDAAERIILDAVATLRT